MPVQPSETKTAGAMNPLVFVWAPVEWLARKPLLAFLVIFILSLAIQCFFLTKVPADYVRPHTRWEMEAVAVSLAQKGQFADPYALPTGPTAHLPPIVPGILGLIFRVFGMTLTAGYVAWTFRITMYSLMYAVLPWLAGRFGLGRPAGLVAGVAGAMMVRSPGHAEALTAILMGLLLLAFLRRWNTAGDSGGGSGGGSFLLGLAWGVAFHVQPALLPVMLGCMAFELWWIRRRRQWGMSMLLALGVIVACVPWAVRNYATFHEVFFIRSNFGLELRMASHDRAAAAMEVMDATGAPHRHPRLQEEEARELGELGEIEYMRQARIEALEWIRTNPGEFLRLTGLRAVHFWCGPLHRPWSAAGVSLLTALALVGLWRVRRVQTAPQRAALLIPLLTYPLIYYIVTYMFRYTVPMNWILLVLAGAEVWFWIKGRGAHRIPPETA